MRIPREALIHVSWLTRLLLAAMSGSLGALSALLPLEHGIRNLLEGALFGAFVLVPLLPPEGRCVPWLSRAAALVAGGMLIQRAAVQLAISLLRATSGHLPLWIAITAAGAAGALLVAALARVAVPLRASGRLWTLAAAAGIVGGLMLSHASVLQLSPVRLIGFVTWQVLVCAALTGFRRDKPGPSERGPSAPSSS